MKFFAMGRNNLKCESLWVMLCPCKPLIIIMIT